MKARVRDIQELRLETREDNSRNEREYKGYHCGAFYLVVIELS